MQNNYPSDRNAQRRMVKSATGLGLKLSPVSLKPARYIIVNDATQAIVRQGDCHGAQAAREALKPCAGETLYLRVGG